MNTAKQLSKGGCPSFETALGTVAASEDSESQVSRQRRWWILQTQTRSSRLTFTGKENASTMTAMTGFVDTVPEPPLAEVALAGIAALGSVLRRGRAGSAAIGC